MSSITQTAVPLLDLNAQYDPIQNDILAVMKEVFESKAFILGPKVEQFEKEIAAYCRAPYAIGVSSGTDAILMALMAMGIGAGDEVITAPFTFFATAGCISRVGATPVFVDIDPKTFNINPDLIEKAITSKTKAIMPVHLFGHMADMEPIMALAKAYNLKVIEDASQAIGTYYEVNGVRKWVGTVGDVGCFSFFPSKNLGCCGDGGLITAQDPELADTLTKLRNHGAQERYYHEMVGGNFRLDAIQAAILSVKLPYLEEQHQLRQENGRFYDTHLKGLVQTPFVQDGFRMIYNQYTLRTSKRDALHLYLNEQKIGNAIYYPLPLHLQKCFAHLGYKAGDFPESEKAAKEVLSIPIYSELTLEQKTRVAEAIQAFYNE